MKSSKLYYFTFITLDNGTKLWGIPSFLNFIGGSIFISKVLIFSFPEDRNKNVLFNRNTGCFAAKHLNMITKTVFPRLS